MINYKMNRRFAFPARISSPKAKEIYLHFIQGLHVSKERSLIKFFLFCCKLEKEVSNETQKLQSWMRMQGLFQMQHQQKFQHLSAVAEEVQFQQQMPRQGRKHQFMLHGLVGNYFFSITECERFIASIFASGFIIPTLC